MALVTYEQFVLSFPEFKDIQDVDLVCAKLEEASREVDPDVWGTRAQDGVKYLAASMLANSPLAQQARLDAKNDIYLPTYKRIRKTITPAGFTT